MSVKNLFFNSILLKYYQLEIQALNKFKTRISFIFRSLHAASGLRYTIASSCSTGQWYHAVMTGRFRKTDHESWFKTFLKTNSKYSCVLDKIFLKKVQTFFFPFEVSFSKSILAKKIKARVDHEHLVSIPRNYFSSLWQNKYLIIKQLSIISYEFNDNEQKYSWNGNFYRRVRFSEKTTVLLRQPNPSKIWLEQISLIEGEKFDDF